MIICTPERPGLDGDRYRMPYVEAVEGKRHAFMVEHKSPISDRPARRYVQWTRNPDHPQDPKCPSCP